MKPKRVMLARRHISITDRHLQNMTDCASAALKTLMVLEVRIAIDQISQMLCCLDRHRMLEEALPVQYAVRDISRRRK